MKKIILTLLILIPTLLLINHINKVLFMNDFKKSLNGIYINWWDFLDDSITDLDNKDVISLLACLYNRKIGYSMKESVEYVEGIPVSKVTDILNNKICELESEVKETKNLIDYLTTLKVGSETDFYNIGSAKK